MRGRESVFLLFVGRDEPVLLFLEGGGLFGEPVFVVGLELLDGLGLLVFHGLNLGLVLLLESLDLDLVRRRKLILFLLVGCDELVFLFLEGGGFFRDGLFVVAFQSGLFCSMPLLQLFDGCLVLLLDPGQFTPMLVVSAGEFLLVLFLEFLEFGGMGGPGLLQVFFELGEVGLEGFVFLSVGLSLRFQGLGQLRDPRLEFGLSLLQ